MAMTPNFSDITYFLEVANTQNISRAAERLGLAQPSLSSAIRRLEEALGVELLIRSKSGVQLTRAGLEMQKQGRLLVQNWEQIKSDIHKKETHLSGEFRIGCHPSVGLYSLSKFIPQLMKDHPGLELKILHDHSRKITESVISFNIDFGIVVNPVQHPDLVIKELCQDEVLFWTKDKPSSLQRPSSGEAVLVCDLELNQVQKLMTRFKKRKIAFDRIIQSNNLEIITELTASGAGVGILPRRVATRSKVLKLKPLSDQPTSFKDSICLVYRSDLHRNRTSQIIVESIRNGFQ